MSFSWPRPLLPGLVLGYTVGRLGFADYFELRQMLLLRDLRLLLAFATAVVLCVGSFWVLHGWVAPASLKIGRGTVLGAALFGVGWALTGACPGVALVQVGQGTRPGLVTLAGILAGIWIQSRLQPRSSRGSPGC